jgi:hypothetical protein
MARERRRRRRKIPERQNKEDDTEINVRRVCLAGKCPFPAYR